MVISVDGISYGYVFGTTTADMHVVPENKRFQAHAVFYSVFHTLTVVKPARYARDEVILTGEITQETLVLLQEVTS